MADEARRRGDLLYCRRGAGRWCRGNRSEGPALGAEDLRVVDLREDLVTQFSFPSFKGQRIVRR